MESLFTLERQGRITYAVLSHTCTYKETRMMDLPHAAQQSGQSVSQSVSVHRNFCGKLNKTGIAVSLPCSNCCSRDFRNLLLRPEAAHTAAHSWP